MPRIKKVITTYEDVPAELLGTHEGVSFWGYYRNSEKRVPGYYSFVEEGGFPDYPNSIVFPNMVSRSWIEFRSPDGELNLPEQLTDYVVCDPSDPTSWVNKHTPGLLFGGKHNPQTTCTMSAPQAMERLGESSRNWREYKKDHELHSLLLLEFVKMAIDEAIHTNSSSIVRFYMSTGIYLQVDNKFHKEHNYNV